MRFYFLENKYILFISSLFFIFSCSNLEHANEAIFLNYANDKENGLRKSISYNDIDLSLTLIPSQYFLLKDNDISALASNEKSRLFRDYSYSVYFLLDISPVNRTNRIIDRHTYNVEEFKRKTHGLNFNLEQLVSLKYNDKEYYPVLSSLQNVYELEGGKSVLLAYQIDDKINTDFKISFNDQIFTGEIFEFKFSKTDFNNIPQLSI